MRGWIIPFILVGCGSIEEPEAPLVVVMPSPTVTAPAPVFVETQAPQHETLREVAEEVRRAFEERDGRALAALAAPTGVRFSPYAHVTESDVILSPSALAGAFDDPRVRLWGSYDGTGRPIELDFAGYVARFVVSSPRSQPDRKTDPG